MTTAGSYSAAINKLLTEITEISINHQTVAQRDDLDDLSTRRYKFADGSVFTNHYQIKTKRVGET